MEKRLLLVLNPCAGQRRANRLLPEIVRIFLDHGYRCETYITAYSGDAARFVEAYAGEYDRVVCIGGDGTLNETFAGIMKAKVDIPVGYIPAGTTNDYASSIGLSNDILQAARDAVTGTVNLLDVGSFNGRFFSYTASCGAFTRASYSTSQTMKNMLGHLAYLLEGIKDIAMIRPLHLCVEANGALLDDSFIFCAITNSTSVGGILKLNAQMVALNDGRFEVMLVRNPADAIQLSRIIHGLTTLTLPNDMIHFFSADRIRVISDEPLEWTLDGERAESGTETELLNLHGAIRIVTPTVMAAPLEDS